MLYLRDRDREAHKSREKKFNPEVNLENQYGRTSITIFTETDTQNNDLTTALAPMTFNLKFTLNLFVVLPNLFSSLY